MTRHKSDKESRRELADACDCSIRDKAMLFSSTAAWSWDISSGRVEFFPEWRDILALPPDQSLGADLGFLFGRMRKEDFTLLRDQCNAITSGVKDSLDLPIRLRRFDNTWAWILLRGKTDAEGECPGVFAGVAVEVSRLRLDKRFFPPTLDDTQTSYQSLLEHSPNNIIRFDRELFPLYMNPAVAKFLSYSLEELGAKKVAELGTDSSDLDFIQVNVEQVFASGEVIKVRRSIIIAQGTLEYEFTFWPELGADKRVKSVLCLQQDLTAELHREREAHANEARFSALFELTQMNDAPEEDVIRFVVAKIAELTESEFSHLHIMPVNPGLRGQIAWSESHYSQFSEEELEGTDPERIREEFGIASDGEPANPVIQNFPVTGSANLFFKGKLPITKYLLAPALEDGNVMCLAAVYNKKTEYTQADMLQLQTFINGAWLVLRRRRFIEELQKAKESAETANKVKDRFLANVSHELRTPLNGMLSMLQLLEFSTLNPEQREYAKSAASTGQALLRIISDILDFSKMESGKMELDCNPFDLRQSLEATVGMFRAEAGDKGLALHLTLDGEFPYMVNGDEARVRQILFNLIGNALKFTEQGTVEVDCTVRESGKDRVTAHLVVRDTGIGISPDMQTKVFDAFTQADGSSTRKHQGSGLGLGIVRELTRLMGGVISLSSYPGHGTMVECSIPFAAISESLMGEDSKMDARDAAMPECPALDVLVAEDDTVSRLAMKLFLEKLGHRVACVTNGREALEALRLYSFDCLISDVLMPEMDGIEVTRHIRAGDMDALQPSDAVRKMVRDGMPQTGTEHGLLPVPRDIPIVAVSAHAMKGDKEHFLAEGMDYYLSKPVKIKDLAAMLRRVHEHGQRPEQGAARPGC